MKNLQILDNIGLSKGILGLNIMVGSQNGRKLDW